MTDIDTTDEILTMKLSHPSCNCESYRNCIFHTELFKAYHDWNYTLERALAHANYAADHA